MLTLRGSKELLRSLTHLCHPFICFSMAGNWLLGQDAFCDTLTGDASAGRGGDQLPWTRSQTPSSLKTQAAAQNIPLFAFWQGTASKALSEGERNNVWQWPVSYPTRAAVPQPDARPVPGVSGLRSPVPTYTVPRGKAAVSPSATLRHLCHHLQRSAHVLAKQRTSAEQPPHPGTGAWRPKPGTAGICSSFFFSVNCLQ